MPRGGKQTPLTENLKNEIVRLYRENQDLNVKAVAELSGCAISTAWNILMANGVEIRGASKWQKEKDNTEGILRRWDAGKSSLAIARRLKLEREGVTRVIVANRRYDDRVRKLLKAVFGEIAETRAFLNSIHSPGNVGRCAICRSQRGKLWKNYCPHTGKFRDLLCSRCTQGLGCFNNDARTVLRAAAYLIRHAAVSGAGLPSVPAERVRPARYQASMLWGRA